MNETFDYGLMVAALSKPGKAIVEELTPLKAERLHMAVGLAGELFELQDCLNYDPTNTNCDQTHLIEELGDIEFYLEGLMQLYKVTPPKTFTSTLSGDDEEIFKNNRRLQFRAGNILDKIKKEVIYNKEDPNLESQIVDDIRNFRIHFNIFLNYRFSNMTTTAAIAAIRDANADKLLTGENARYSKGYFTNEAAQKRADKKAER